MKSIREILPSVYRQGADAESVNEELVLSYWALTVGPGIARFARAHRLFGKTLVVIVESEEWQRQLTGLKRRIALQLNKALGAKVVEDIRFRLSRTERPNPLRAKPFSKAAGGAQAVKSRKQPGVDRSSRKQTAKRGKRA